VFWILTDFFCSFAVYCGYRSLAPWGILMFDAPEGSVGLRRALPPCGVESEPYALPHVRATRRKPGALGGYYRMVDFVRSSGFCCAPSEIWCVWCIVIFPGVWADHGVVPWCCRCGVGLFLWCLFREYRTRCAKLIFFAPLRGWSCASTQVSGARFSIIPSQHRFPRTGFEPGRFTRGKN
jgi:hypothetical protein